MSLALAASKIVKKIKDVKIHRGPWSDVQDLVLTRLVAAHGPRNWSKIARLIPGRVGKQCRERWNNHLCPYVKKSEWCDDDDHAILRGVAELGTR